jgi:linoleoyl-CoA desaturase
VHQAAYTFSREKHAEFYTTLKQRVNEYFHQNNISRFANFNMYFKTGVMLTMVFVPYAFMLSGLVSSYWVMLLMWMIMGLGMGGIGMAVMHDAIHGSYSGKPWVNKMFGYTLNLIGANASLWRLQHNVLHHTYTNIDGMDDDIHTPPFLRFSPHQKRYWIHRYQHLYVWFFYSVSTLFWVTTKDFGTLFRYYKKGLIKSKKALWGELAQIIAWKILYYAYILVLPIWLMPFSALEVISAFVVMHLVMGMVLSLIFQTAHVIPAASFPLPDSNGKMDNNWAVHQMITTSNYSPKSRFFSWFIGSLNNQVEHHLFSNICHVHYKTISVIVKDTAYEFGVPYYSQRTFLHAIWYHAKTLKGLGRGFDVAEPSA